LQTLPAITEQEIASVTDMYNCHLDLDCIVWGADILNLKISKNYAVVCLLVIYVAEMLLNPSSVPAILGFRLAVHEI